MSFFRRKEQNLIPEPEKKGPAPPRSPAPSYKTTASTYAPSRDGDLYGNDNRSYNQQPSSGGYNSSRGGASDPARSELFSGYNPERAGPNRFTASDRGPELQEPTPGEENEEDVEGIKQQIRTTKQESVNSTRNALRLAREAEETARGTLLKLGNQSGAFSSFRHHRYLLIV
jgi:hypothetical protein